jgi:hypothetical protein
MASVVIVVLLALALYAVITGVQRHRRGLVAERGTSIGADLGVLGDRPRVIVREVTPLDHDRVHLVLVPEDATSGSAPPDLDFVISLRQDEFGYDLLRQWQQATSVVAVVLPPNSTLVRLRSVDSLQPITLKRAAPH